jgi:choline monooxygenase
MVPEADDYRSQEWKDHGQMLMLAQAAGRWFWQMSNVCRHRQAIMLQGSGNAAGNIVCPIHRWTYDTRRPADRRAAFSRRTPAST